MKVIYNSTGGAGPSSGQICTVDGGSLQCRPDYTPRVSVFSALELRGVTPSDGGVYSIVDIRNGDVVRSYTVTVQGMNYRFVFVPRFPKEGVEFKVTRWS